MALLPALFVTFSAIIFVVCEHLLQSDSTQQPEFIMTIKSAILQLLYVQLSLPISVLVTLILFSENSFNGLFDSFLDILLTYVMLFYKTKGVKNLVFSLTPITYLEEL